MRKFNVTINGKTYEVEVEEVKDNHEQTKLKDTLTQQPVKNQNSLNKTAISEQKIKTEQITNNNTGSKVITAPMPGTIIDIKVKEGQNVKRGDVVLILEAMKMENEIMAAEDGVIATINVAKGSSVNTGEILVSMN